MARYIDEDLGLIPISDLANSLNTSRDVLLPYLVTLQHLNFIHLRCTTAEHVHLTMNGRKPLFRGDS